MKPSIIEDRDLDLKVLYEPRQGPASIDVVAVHGTNAHPDHTWAKLKDDGLDKTNPENYVSWLSDAPFLPQAVPSARIMRYGYRSGWYGENRVRVSSSEIAIKLLSSLAAMRRDANDRPLVFIAHSFGGLVVVRSLIEASKDASRWSSIHECCTGLLFFGTPFRGSDRHDQARILTLAAREFGTTEVFDENMRIFFAGNEALDDLMRSFHMDMAQSIARPLILCVYEQQYTNIATIVNREETLVSYWVNRDSGTLDLSRTWPRNCNHFDINKFRDPSEQDFAEIRRFLCEVHEQSAAIITRRRDALRDTRQGLPIPAVLCQHFQTRPELTSRLNQFWAQASDSPTRVAIWGLGGAGKTQLALDFINSVKHAATVFWIRGDKEEHFVTDLVQISAHLSGSSPETTHAAATLSRCKTLFESLQRPLVLVIDNVDDASLFLRPTPNGLHLRDALPSTGLIIITTRDRSVVGTLTPAGNGIHVQMMDDEAAFRLFESSVTSPVKDENGEPLPSVVWLVKQLGNLPLAIAQCAATIRADELTLDEFIESYKQTETRALIMSRGLEEFHNYPPAILTTWEVTFERIKSTDARAVTLLMTLANLHWSGLATYLLESLDCVRQYGRYVFNQILAVLVKYCIVEKRTASEGYVEVHVHPLVHFWLQQRASPVEAITHVCDALSLMVSVFDMTHYDNKAFNAYLLPHALQVVSRCEDTGHESTGLSRLLQVVSVFFADRGYQDSALNMILWAEELALRVWGERSASRYLIQVTKARVLCSAGKFADSADAFQEAYDLLIRVDGDEAILNREGEKMEVLREYLATLTYIRSDRVNDPVFDQLDLVDMSTLGALELHNLSFAMLSKKNYDLMEKLSDAAWEKVNNGTVMHEKQLLAMKNMRGHILRTKNDMGGALALFAPVLDRSFDIMDCREMDLWINACNVLGILSLQDRFAEIIAYTEKLFAKWDGQGSGRLLQKAAQVNLHAALAYLRQGRCAAARACWTAAIAWRREAVEYDDPDEGLYFYNIAVSYVQEGDWEGALRARAEHAGAIREHELTFGTLESRRARFAHARELWLGMNRATSGQREEMKGCWSAEEAMDFQRAVYIYGPLEEPPVAASDRGLERYFDDALHFPPFL